MAKRSTAEESEESLSLHPRASETLVAHEAVEKQLLSLIHAKRLPHALLLTGPRGIGKATFAYRIARFLLDSHDEPAGLFGEPLPAESLHIPASNPTFRRMMAESHPDLLVLEADDIKVQDTRLVGEFLSLTPAQSQWRVVIIDSADSMNRNAANALLKILEEPPAQAVLLLVSHNPGTLLPTIRSRCRALRFAPLDEIAFAKVMEKAAPEMSPADYVTWSLMSGSSPGIALLLKDAKADVLYRELLERVCARDALKLHQFADRFTRKDADGQWKILCLLLQWLLARITLQHAHKQPEFFLGEQAQLQRISSAKPLDTWLELWERTSKLLSDTDRFHLDHKQVILTIVRAIGE